MWNLHYGRHRTRPHRPTEVPRFAYNRDIGHATHKTPSRWDNLHGKALECDRYSARGAEIASLIVLLAVECAVTHPIDVGCAAAILRSRRYGCRRCAAERPGRNTLTPAYIRRSVSGAAPVEGPWIWLQASQAMASDHVVETTCSRRGRDALRITHLVRRTMPPSIRH